MGWFENQIKERIAKDDENVSNSFYDLSSVIMGKSQKANHINNKNMKTRNAIEEICKYYKAPVNDSSDEREDFNDQLEYLLRPSGIMRRRVKLSGQWWKDSMGALLGETKKGEVVALIPTIKGYSFYDYESKKN